MRIVPSDISFSKSELLLTGLEEKDNIGVKCLLQKIKLHLKAVYLPQQFSILFHLLLLKTVSRDKNGLFKINEASVGLVFTMVQYQQWGGYYVIGEAVFQWKTFLSGLEKMLSMLGLVLRGLFCRSANFLYVQSLRVHRSKSSINSRGGNIEKRF